MVNGNMALAKRKGHNDRISVRNTTMPLRERIKRLVGKGIQVSWKSLPEVKASGLLETLTERQLALEERKFCLITSEVVYNTQLLELIGLYKQSVSYADQLPKFKRRTAVTAIERVKCCSDQFLDAFEKHWNMTPAVGLAVLNNILQDLAPQFQHYVTYCGHQEDLSTVLHSAMKNRRQVVAASFGNRLNLECVLLPLQHLKLCCFLLKDIHSMLTSTSNHLDTFHCSRILADINKLFGECSKLLVKLHGSQYIKNTDRLLDKSVRGLERESRRNTVSKHQKNVSVDPKIVCRKESTDSVHDTDCMTSEVRTMPDVNKHKLPSVKEQCKHFDPQIAEDNFRDMAKCGDKCDTLKRQECVQVGRRKAVDTISKHRSSQFIRKRCAIFEGGETHSLDRKQNCYTNSGHSASHLTNNTSNTTVTGRRRNVSKCETANSSLGNNGSGSENHIGCFKDKQNISVDNNKKPFPIICSSIGSSGSSISSSSSRNNNRDNEPPKSIPPIITDSCLSSLSKSSRNSANSGIESFHESGEVGKRESRDEFQSSDVQNQTIPCSVLQNNCCQEVLEECDAATQLDSRLTVPTFTVSPPLKVEYKTMKTYCLEDNEDADGLQTESTSCNYKVRIELQCSSPNEEEKPSEHGSSLELQCSPPNEEEKPSEHGSSLSNQHCDSGSPSGDGLSSVSEEILYTEVLFIDTDNIEQSPETEQQNFVSSCDSQFTSTAHLPSQEDSDETDKLHNDYKPMTASFRRNCYQIKPITPSSELLIKNAREADDCGNEYEEIQPLNTHDICSGKSNSSIFSAYDFPLYQRYDSERVQYANTEAEGSIYIEADEHVYEEINFCAKLQSETDGQEDSVPELEISQPLGNIQQLRWVNVTEVANSGLLAEMSAEQIALQETKYEIISSESSYYKSLLILETVFIMSKELTDTAVLRNEDHMTLFSDVIKAKKCSEKFLSALLDGWPEDLKLNYLCHAFSEFVSSGSLQVYVDCCGSQKIIEKTLQHLMLTNSKFDSALSKLQADPVCEMFSLRSFLILPMQRVIRLPLLVEAIIKRLPSDHAEHSVWTDALVQLRKIADECNEAAGRAEALEAELFGALMLQPDIKKKSLTLNHLPQGRTKKQTSVWKIFSRGRQKEE